MPCARGPERLPEGAEAVHALSWEQVACLTERFRSLSPYDRDTVSEPILKIEEVNRDLATKEPRQLYAFAISAKRYALFVKLENGDIEVVEAKQHGLGHLLNPMDLDQDDRGWITQVWAALIREALGQPFRLPAWVDRPALSRVTVSTTGISRTFAEFNNRKSYVDAIKPMNFILSPTVATFGHPDGVDPERFHLFGAYEKDPTKWRAMPWFDKYSGCAFRIGVGRDTPGDMVQVKSYRDVILEYRVHPEPKSLDATGEPCDRASRGLLVRRPVQLGSLVYVGKESNQLEQVGQGLVHSRAEVQPSYQPPQLTPWQRIYRPAICRVPLDRLVGVTGRGSREIRYYWKGERQPPPAVEQILRAEAVRWARRAIGNPDLSEEDCAVASRVLAAEPPGQAKRRVGGVRAKLRRRARR